MATCHHCGASDYARNGRFKGVQRYLCRGCGRSFTSRGERIPRAVREQALLMHLNNVGIRKIALFLKVSPASVVNWVRKAGEALAEELARASETARDTRPDVIEMDEVYTFVQKNAAGRSYGLLIAGGRVALLPTSSETRACAPPPSSTAGSSA